MFTTNKELANIFAEMALLYRYFNGSNPFRVRAYEKASNVLDNLTDDIRHHLGKKNLISMTGIGESIAEKIIEYLDTGKIEKYEQLKKEMPGDFLELLKVEGIGPKTLLKLNQQLKISSKESLIKAIQSGKVDKLEGFGKKSAQNMLEGIRRYEKASQRILLQEALELSELVKEKMADCEGMDQMEIAGSIRRGKETIGDIDLLVAAPKKHWPKIIQHFIHLPFVDNILASGKTKASVQITHQHRDVDLRIVLPAQWGAALLYFTGSKSHNIHLRRIAQKKGWKINEYGLFDQKSRKKLAGKTEEDMYRKLGLQYVPPEMRENQGEIDLAKNKQIPKLITRSDIKGDLHLHSNWSDGSHSIEEIARYAMDKLSYEYLVLTDHSKSSRIANGMDEKRFKEQFKEIDEVNKKLGKPFVKKGVEVDILPDGSLDFPDDFLQQFDWVIASIHSRFKDDNTDRLIKACENPQVNAIGHPSGRLIGQREAYPVDMEKVIEAAARTGTALEINAQPQRMDLNDHWAGEAREKGVPLVISTDMHSLSNFDFMELGILVARRAWCKAGDVLNTKKWKEVKKVLVGAASAD
jgi:DNA polymerase (family 10)